jgi:ATP synthase protein I
MTAEEDLRKRLEQQAARMKKAERERPTVLAQTVYVGTLGLLIVLPIVVGAYVGHWLDAQLEGYSTSWTVSLIIVGVFIGAVNAYLFVRE